MMKGTSIHSICQHYRFCLAGRNASTIEGESGRFQGQANPGGSKSGHTEMIHSVAPTGGSKSEGLGLSGGTVGEQSPSYQIATEVRCASVPITGPLVFRIYGGMKGELSTTDGLDVESLGLTPRRFIDSRMVPSRDHSSSFAGGLSTVTSGRSFNEAEVISKFRELLHSGQHVRVEINCPPLSTTSVEGEHDHGQQNLHNVETQLFNTRVETPRRSPEEIPQANLCSYCNCVFSTKSGLGLHIVRSHPDAEVSRPTKKKRFWKDEELFILAGVESRYRSHGHHVSVGLLREEFVRLTNSERSLSSIKGVRRGAVYQKALQDVLRDIASDVNPQLQFEPRPVLDCVEDYITELLELFTGLGRHSIVTIGNAILEGRDLEINFCSLITELLAGNKRLVPKKRFVVRRQVRKMKRSKKAEEYAKGQNLFFRNRKALFQSIADGEAVLALNRTEAYDYWRGVFETASVVDHANITSYGRSAPVLEPVTVEQIKLALKDQKNKAGGLDGLTYVDLVGCDLRGFSLLYNLMLFRRVVPGCLCLSRTVLIPKKGSVVDPSQCRPISIASVILRTLHAVIAKTWGQSVELHPAQRGFVRCDGALENVSLLHHCITLSRRAKKSIYIAVLDLTKAFDSVSHHSLMRAMRSFRAPEMLQDYLADLYEKSLTKLDISGRLSNEMRPMRGVRQGDPLSPLLFNMMIDEGLRTLPTNLGIDLGGERLNALAFADDLVLMARTKEALQVLLNQMNGFLRARGMTMNISKSFICAIGYDSKRKTNFVEAKPRILICGEELTAVRAGGLFSYLGVKFSPLGKRAPTIHALRCLLQRISKVHLKPEQKVSLIRDFAIPRVLYGLSLGVVSARLLDEVDSLVLSTVKSILRLPHSAPDVAFYLKRGFGGLGLPKLRYSIPLSVRRRLLRMRESSSPFIRALTTTTGYIRELYTVNRLLLGNGLLITTKKDLERLWTSSALKVFGAQGVSGYCEFPPANKWVRGLQGDIRGKNFLEAFKLRFNLLPNRSTTYFGETGAHRHCRAGCSSVETVSHILQQCPSTFGLRIRRHDQVTKLAESALKRAGYSVWVEPHLITENGVRKPDIIARRDNVAWVLDVACPFETFKGICSTYQRKVDYYSDYTRHVTELVGSCLVVRYGAIVVGARGSVCHRTANLWKQLGLPRHYLVTMAQRTLLASVNMNRLFMARVNRSDPVSDRINDRQTLGVT